MKGASYIQQSVALLSVLLLLCGRPGTGKKLIPLTSVHPSGNDTILNLNIRPVRVSVPLRDLGEAETFTYMARLYVYNGVPLLPGPTVHVKPGGRLILNLFNDLGSQYYSADETMMYSFHDVNTTNIHFHGLHANPAIDDVFKVVNPRQSIRYRLPIPETHLPGLHWYHTHSHGSSYALLMGGLFGALVVDCGRNDVLAGKPHVTLIIHLYRMGASTLCDGDTMQLVDSAIGSNMSSRPRILDGKGRELRGVSDLFLVNGQHRPTVTVREGETTIFRMLFAAGSCYLNVSLPETCQFHLIAADGVPLETSREVVDRWLYFTTATRYDVAVQCSEGHLDGIEHPVSMTETGDVLFYVGIAERVGKHRDLMKFPVQSRAVESSHYLNTRETAILRDISFSQLSLPDRKPYYIIGQGTDCASLVNSSKCYYEHFGGQKGLIYDKYSGFVVPLDSVVEARVFGDPTERMPHPFHAHVNHFVFVSFVPRKGGHHENVSLLDYGIFPGDIRDTIPILDGVTTIRWRAATYAGEVVYHCHTLTHEDRGMMTSYLVYQDNASAPSPDVLHPVGYDSITTRRRRQIFLLLFVFFFTATVVSTVFSCIRAEPPGSMRAKHEPLNVPRVETKNALSDLECVPLVRRPGL